MRASQLVTDVRRDLASVDEAIRSHPYPDALATGSIPPEAITTFVGHQYHIVTSDLRSIAMLVHRFGHTRARDFFAGVLQGELAGLQGILAMGRKLNLTEEDLATYEVAPEGFAYAAFMAWQAFYASAAEFVCGILVNFEAWGFNCGRMSRALQEQYGFGSEDTVFLDAFATMPPFEETALEIIQEGLDQGVAPQRMRRAARLFQGYEKMFWDTMAELSGVAT